MGQLGQLGQPKSKLRGHKIIIYFFYMTEFKSGVKVVPIVPNYFISGAENLKPTVSLPIGVIRKLIFISYNLKLFSNAIL